MSEVINKALTTLCEKVLEMPMKVLDIFNNFFGEERVDMQGFPTKSRIKHSIEDMTVATLFGNANMGDRLPINGANRNELLMDIDLDNLPEDTEKLMAEAIASEGMVGIMRQLFRGGFILVHFPRVTVTNEYDRSTIVNHLYVKVPILVNGAEDGLFTMNRSEYTLAELRSGYMHSHASHIPLDNFKEFSRCCLGSGPLNNTQTNLSIGFDEDRWNIFCLELSKYVEVESIAGTPYFRLENISLDSRAIDGLGRLSNSASLYIPHSASGLKDLLREFMSYYLDNNDLTFSYRNGVYSIGMTFEEYLIRISNSLIEWINNNPKYHEPRYVGHFDKIISSYTFRNGTLYEASSNSDIQYTIDRFREHIGKEICTFKGKTIRLVISDIDNISNSDENTVRLLNPSLASFLLNRIITVINYRYGRNQEDPSTTAGKVRYEI